MLRLEMALVRCEAEEKARASGARRDWALARVKGCN